MKVLQQFYSNGVWKTDCDIPEAEAGKVQLVFAFGAGSLITDPAIAQHIRDAYPSADIVYASTSGEILKDAVLDDSVVVTALSFEKTSVRCTITNIVDHTNSFETGKFLMKELQEDDLCHVFIVSDGTHINGSELVTGINESNPRHIPVTGGLAGDGARFTRTFAGLNQAPGEGMIVAIGFYGDHLKIGHGSLGGWDEFGPVRTITRSQKNVLYEIDGKNALDLYKEYLGPYKEELPGSALLFPLSIKEPAANKAVVRTILNIHEEDHSMVFAGNLPEGSQVRLMKANFDKLIDASSTAARYTFDPLDKKPDLALLISCVGRKLILQERVEEEVQAAKEIFGESTCIAGFYSYGEISPFQPASRCELHNQTMTITTFTEL